MADLSFFSRFGFTGEDRADCHELLRRLFPEHELTTHKYQGYCSYTVLLLYRPRYRPALEQGALDDEHDDGFWNQSLVVQFRPPPFALDIQTASLARTIYGAFAPRVRSLGRFAAQTHHTIHRDAAHSRHQIGGDAGDTSTLTMTAQTLIPGLPYSAIQPHTPHLSPAQRARQEALVADFAAFLARGWRRDSDGELPLQSGPLNAATPHKLRQLSAHLPSRRLRSAARRTLAALPLLRLLPLALNHGDVVPGNVMAATDGCGMAGLVDWAEAEVGAWGVPLYGLEFLLGFVGRGEGAAAWRWTYYSCAGELRRLFWREIKRRIVELAPSLMQAIRVARDVGVLLWFGFAWEEGRIDRVVDGVRDPREVLLLETFLGVGG
ncbi:hypothetical protein BC567DRAFT_174988, partial [Phyllosticta citribraziliensis]